MNHETSGLHRASLQSVCEYRFGLLFAILWLRTDALCVGVFLDRASSTRGQWAAMRALASVPLPALCALSVWHVVAFSLFALRQVHHLCSRFWIPIALRHASY